MTFETVIGIEVHAQLKTCSKLFSSAATAYGAPANTQASFIDAGLPGVLPVLNQEAVRLAIQFGLSIGAVINDLSYFERKNYFYADLPKGYQISQFQRPIIGPGHLDILKDDGTIKKIDIQRAHLEEDAGKSLHDIHPTHTGIDLNRAGTPLLEIVTTPCIFSASEAISYLKTLHQLLRFLDICDGNMQEGSFRCDINLSLRPMGETQLGTRTELKNLNSFRFIEKAIHHEQCRHQDLLESGQKITQETRLYCPKTNSTQVLRNKENENDYRYFPDPDLLPIKITESFIADVLANCPERPSEIRQRLLDVDHLSMDDVDFLLTSRATIQYYDEVKGLSRAPVKTIANWLKGSYSALLNEKGLSLAHPPVSAKDLAHLLDHLANKTINTQLSKVIFAQLASGSQSIEALISHSISTLQNDDHVLEDIICKLLEQHPQQVEDYRAGKEKLLAFFVGQVMKQTKGQLDASKINALIYAYLEQTK